MQTAKDGVDALQQLQDLKPAVMLVDIEMPRMDGFELTRNIRANDDTRHIPIIMITSRTADKHRNYANELGVNVFLGKPYQEDELLAISASLCIAEPGSGVDVLGKKKAAAAAFFLWARPRRQPRRGHRPFVSALYQGKPFPTVSRDLAGLYTWP